jgi:hypothetical protein
VAIKGRQAFIKCLAGHRHALQLALGAGVDVHRPTATPSSSTIVSGKLQVLSPTILIDISTHSWLTEQNGIKM